MSASRGSSPPTGSPPPYTAPISPPLRSRSVPQLANLGLSGFTPDASTTAGAGWLPPILDGRLRFREPGSAAQRPPRLRRTSSSTLVSGIPTGEDTAATTRRKAVTTSSWSQEYRSRGFYDAGGDDSGGDDALEIAPRARTSSRRAILPSEITSGTRPALRRTSSEQGAASVYTSTAEPNSRASSAVKALAADSASCVPLSPGRKDPFADFSHIAVYSG